MKIVLIICLNYNCVVIIVDISMHIIVNIILICLILSKIKIILLEYLTNYSLKVSAGLGEFENLAS